MATRRYDCTLPRDAVTGLWRVQVIDQTPDPNEPGEWLVNLYPLKDEATGEVLTFDNPMKAWTAWMNWKAQQQAQQ